MRLLARALLGLAAVLALAVVALAVLAPRLIDRPELRERIALAAQAATGRTLQYERLDVGLLPLRLEAFGAALEGGPKHAPLRAERVALEVALLPLLARTVLVDTLVVRGAELTLVRGRNGIELPIAPPVRQKAEPSPDGEDAASAAGGGVSLALREVRIEQSRVTLRDDTVRPPVAWTLDALDLRARGRLLVDAPIPFELTADLHGAKLQIEGEASRAGALDLRIALAKFPLERLQPYLPAPLTLAGAADLELALKGELARFAGPLSVELSAAEITRGATFRKPAGERAAFEGRLVRDGAALRIEDGLLALADAELAVSAEIAPRVRARLAAPRIELASFDGWLPALGAAGASGAVGFDAFDVRLDPLALSGGIVLDDVSAPVGETRGSLRGRLEGRGDSLVGDALELRVAEQPFRLGLTLDALASEPQAALRLRSEGTDSGSLVSGLSGKPSTLEGPLALGADLRAPLSDPDTLLRALSGQLQLGVTPGKLRGVSLLRSAFAALGSAGGVAERLSGAKRGELARYYSDAFETLAGSFQIRGGKARTNDLRLVYPDYQVDLAGALGLLDRSLDFRGKLTLFEELDRTLGDGARGVKRELPLAAVRGTLDDPRVSISPQVALAFAAGYYGGGERREKLERAVDERLGTGSGKQVLDLLDSVLGGGAKRKAEEP